MNSQSYRSQDRTRMQKYGSLSFQNSYDPVENDRYSQSNQQKRTNGMSTDLRKNQPYNQTSVISISELQRIKKSIDQQPSLNTTDSNKQQAEERQYARERRLKQEYEKKKDLQKEKFKQRELEQQKIDRMEEELRQRQNTEILKKANQQIFERNEKVRALKSQMLFADILKEQEYLNDVKLRQTEIKKAQEQEYNEEQQRLRQEEYNKIIMEDEIRKKKKDETQKMIIEQVKDAKAKAIQRYQDEKLEGQMFREQAIKELEEQELKKKAKKLQSQKLIDEMKGIIEVQKAYKQKFIDDEKKEEKKIEQERTQKELITKLKNERAQLLADQIRQQKEKLIEEGTQRLKLLKDNENQRIANQIEQTEAKKVQEEKIKQEKLKKLRGEIDISIQQSITNRKKAQIDEKQKDVEFMTALQEKYKQLDEQEKEEKLFHITKEIELKKYNLQMMNDKHERKKQEFIEDLKEANKIKEDNEVDNLIFDQWADTVLNDYENEGKNTMTMKKNLNTMKKMVY